MKQLKIAISLITASMLLYACPKYEVDYITFVNKSESRIVFQPHFLNANPTNEDTLFQCTKGGFNIHPDTLYRLGAGRHSNWENEMKRYSHLQLLVMDYKILSNYLATPCDTIRKYVPILHRYQLTLEDLRRMNWTVVYPPEK